MSNIRLLAVLPFLAIATVANAGTTISDSRYWPNQAHPNVYGNSRAEADSRVAHRRTTDDRIWSSKACTYRGDPKTGRWSCQ